jgi:ribosomal protein S18 acetylase RimI-like enzyme
MTTKIFSATRKDLDELIGIYAAPSLKASVEESTWFVNCYFDYHHVLVAKADGKVFGACFWRIEGERTCGLGWIENIWVEETHRGEGLGEQLLNKAIADMKSFFDGNCGALRKVILTTQESRQSARKLYERVGFKKAAVLQEAYGPEDNDIIFVLDVHD